MANRVQYTIGFGADIREARKAIQDLGQALDKAISASSGRGILDEDIKQASKAAKELQVHLQKAFNQNTGKLDLSAFNKSLKDAGQNAESLMNRLVNGGAAGQQAFYALASSIAQSEVPLKRVNSTLRDFATTLKNTVKWELSSNIVHGLEGALSGAVSYAKNLNTSLTNIRIVTGQTVEDMAKFTKEANAAAKELSTTTKAYADAALIYYQQGDSQEMVAKKAAITIKAANSSFGTTATEMSEYLTAVWNSYQVGADELERYVDIMASLGAKTATSLEEIATSMQKVAATANTVGVSMEQVSSIIATVSSVTRESAESIGTSYKTIFARIGDLKLGGADEDGVGLGLVSSQLDAIGISIMDTNGELRDMGDIIMELGNKWQTMSGATKTAVAQAVAGKRQYTQLMALFENWDMFMENLGTAENATGSLDQMASIYEESWEAASNRARAALEGIYNQIIDDQGLIKITDGVAAFTEQVGDTIQMLGGVPGVLMTIGNIGSKVFKDQIANSLDKTISNLNIFMSQFKSNKKILDTLKNIKSVSQLQYQKDLQEASKDIDSTSLSSGEKNKDALVIQNARALITLKQDLINNEHKLTQAQKEQYLARMDQLSAQGAELVKQAAALDELASAERRLAAQARVSTQKANVKKEIVGAGVSRVAIANEIDKNSQAQKFLSAFQQGGDATAYVNAIQKLSAAWGMVDAAQAKALKIEDAEKLTSIFNTLRKSLTETVGNETILKRLKMDTIDSKNALEDLQNQLIEVVPALEEALRSSLPDADKPIIDALSENAFNKGRSSITLGFGEDFFKEEFKGFKDFFKEGTKDSKTFGQTIATAGSAIMSLVSGIQTAYSSAKMFGDESATAFDKFQAGASIATQAIMGFQNGLTFGLINTAVLIFTSLIGHFNAEAERATQLLDENYQKAVDKLNSRSEENKEIGNLTSQLIILNEQKIRGLEVDEQISDISSQLAEKYNLEGIAVQSLTQDYINLAKAQAKENTEEAIEGRALALDNIKRNANLKVEAYSTGTEVGPYGETFMTSKTGVKFVNAYKADSQNMEGTNFTLDEFLRNNPEYIELFETDSTNFSDGEKVLQWNNYASGEEKNEKFKLMEDLVNDLNEAGVSITDPYLSGLKSFIATLEPHMAEADKFNSDLHQSLSNELSLDLIGKSITNYDEYFQALDEIETALRDKDEADTDLNLSEAEISQIVFDTLDFTEKGRTLGSVIQNTIDKLGIDIETAKNLTEEATNIIESLGAEQSDVDENVLSLLSIGENNLAARAIQSNKEAREYSQLAEIDTKMDQVSKLLSEDITSENYAAMKKAYQEAYELAEGNMLTWEEFIAMNKDAQEAYIASIPTKVLDDQITAKAEEVIVKDAAHKVAATKLSEVESQAGFNKDLALAERDAILSGEKQIDDLDPLIREWYILQEAEALANQELIAAQANLENLNETKELKSITDQMLSFKQALSSIPQSLEEIGKMSDSELAILADNIKTLTGEVVDFNNMSDEDILRTALVAQAKGIEQEIKDAQALLDSATDAQTRITGEEAVAEAYQRQRENKEALITLDNQLLQASKNRHTQEVAQTEKEIEQLKKAADYFGSGNELTNAQRAEISAAPGGEDLVKQWDNATSAAERYEVAVKAIQASSEKENQLLKDRKALIDYSTTVLKNTEDKIKGSLTSADALASRLKDLGYENDNTINQIKELYESLDLTGIEDPDKIFQLLIDAAKKAGLDIENELALMDADLKDALIETSNNYAKALQEDAEKTVDAWRDAFDTILALKEGLASGKTMAEIIMGDPKQFADTLGQMQVALGDAFDLTRAMVDDNYFSQMLEKSGLLKYDPVSQNRAAYGEKSYYDQNGQKMSLEQYQANMVANGQFKTWGEAEESYYSQAVFESLNQMGVEAEQAAASLDNVQTAFESYKGVVEDTTSIAHGLNQAETERLQEAVKNAQEAKADGKSMQDLEEEDRRLLEQNGITFENLDIAAVDCTTALAQLAEAALNAAKAQAKEEGYSETEDGTWYKETATMDELTSQKLANGYGLTQAGVEEGWEVHGIDEAGNVIFRKIDEAVSELLQGKQQEVDASAGDVQDTFYAQNQYDVEAATRQMDAVGAYNEAGADVEKQASAIKDLREAYTGLEDCQEIIDQLEQGTKDWDEANRELTTTALSQVKSVNKLSDSQFDLYKQHLKNNNVVADGFNTTEEYIEALEEQRKEYKKNIKAGEDLEKTFKKGTKAAKDLGKYIEGDTIDNFDELTDAFEGMQDIDPINFNEMFDGMDPQTVGSLLEGMGTAAVNGANSASEALHMAFNTMDSTLRSSAEQIFIACGATAEQAVAGAAALEQALHDTVITPAEWEAICDLIPNFDASALVDTMQQAVNAGEAAGFSIDSGILKALGALSNLSGTRGGSKSRGGYTPRKSGSGRGGSGGGKGGGKKPELKEFDGDELEHIESIIEDIANQVDKAASIAERSFGKQHIKDIDKQVNALKQQIGALNQKIQMLYNQMNMKMAEFAMHVAAASPQFDELAAIVQYDANGMIINMDEVIQKAIQMAQAIAAAAAAGQISIEQANQQIEMLQQIYNTGMEVSNIRSEISATQAQIADLENQIYDLNLEKIMYEIEYQVDINEDDLAIIDYYNAKMEDSLKDQGNIMQNLVDSTWEYVDNLQIYQDAIGKLQTAYDNGEISQAGFAEGLQEVEDGLLDNLHALLELEDEIKAVFKDTLDMASDEIERFTDLIESGSEAMTSFIEIQGLLGNATNYEALQKFYDERTHQDMESLKAQMDYLEVLKEQEKYYQDRLEKNGELGELEQQQYWELQEVMAEVQDNILDKTEETLENIQESFENTINGIFKNLDKNMAGAAGSLANLADDYSYYLEVESRYVTQSRELYEISKLNRQINQQMDDVTTEASKAKLKALQDEINLKSQSQQLTEYDLQLMQLEYEKTLAMIALEEAQNAKDTVRLTRDADGNYVYQYTANEDQVAEKQQQYEDKLIEINDLTLNRTQEMEQMFVDLLNDYHQAAMEIAMNTELTVEERNEALEKLNERFHDSLMFIQEQYNISTEDLLDSNLDISEHFSEELQDQVFDTKEGINKTLELMIDDANRYSDMMKEVVGPGGLVQGTLSDYQKYMDEVAKLTKTDYDNMGAAAVDYSKKADAARKESKKFVDYLASALGTINSATAAWVSMAGSLDAVRASAEAAVAQVQALIKALAELESAESEEDGGGGGGGSTTPPATESKKDTSSSKKKSSNSSTTKKTSSKAEVTVYESSNSKDKTGNTKTTPDNNDVIILKDKNTGYQKEITMMKTGGINVTTGWHWLDGTLSRPELVLNADDTQNMLSIVDMLHSWDNGFLGNIFKTLDVLTGLNLSSMFNTSTPVTPVATTQNAPVEQVVQITAEFPAAEDRNEIKAAFDDLINQASQFVNRRFR